MTDQDWTWTDTSGGTYQIDGADFHSGPVPYDQLPGEVNTDIFYIGAAALPMDSRWARRGVKGVLQHLTSKGEPSVIVQLRRGPLGWFARRWIKKHPLQLNVEMYRPEWGEWRDQSGTVTIQKRST